MATKSRVALGSSQWFQALSLDQDDDQSDDDILVDPVVELEDNVERTKSTDASRPTCGATTSTLYAPAHTQANKSAEPEAHAASGVSGPRRAPNDMIKDIDWAVTLANASDTSPEKHAANTNQMVVASVASSVAVKDVAALKPRARRVPTSLALAAAEAQAAVDLTVPSAVQGKRSRSSSSSHGCKKQFVGQMDDGTMLDLQGCTCHSFFKLGVPIDLETLVTCVPNTQSDLQRGRVYLRALQEPRWTAQVFKDGSVRMLTSYDGDAARIAGKRAARLLQQKYSTDVAFKHYQITNVSVVAKLPFRIRIEDFVSANSETGASVDDDGNRIQVVQSMLQDAHPYAIVKIGENSGTSVRIEHSGVLRVHKSRSSTEALNRMKLLLLTLSQYSVWW